MKNHLIKARTPHLCRPGISSRIYDNVFRRFAGDIKSPSVQKLSVTSPASILTGTQGAGYCHDPSSISPRAWPGSPWGHERRWLREADDSQAQNVNSGGECEKLRLSVRSQQLGLGEGLNWCQLIHFLGFTLAAENVASQGNYSNFEGILLSWTQDNHRENVRVAFWCSTDQHCHTRLKRPKTPLAAMHARPRFGQHTAAVWFLNSEALRLPAEIVFVLLHNTNSTNG